MSPIEPVHLPPRTERASHVASTASPAGGFGESRSRAEALLRRLREGGAGLATRRASAIAETLGEVGRRFLLPDDPLREEALDRLPQETGYSLEMCTTIVTGMARDWTGERLQGLLAAEFADAGVLDGFVTGPHGSRVHADGGRLAFHVGSGNVPGVGTTSILRSLLVKCPVLLKPGRGDRVLPELFARGLSERDPDLAQALAVVYWPHDEGGELERALLEEAERVVVYGGTGTVARLRSRTPVTTPFVGYHHRVSMGAVARESLESLAAADTVARHAAGAVAAYDRRGCVSPQIVWVERGGAVEPGAWSARLARELSVLDRSLPPAPPAPAEASALRQLEGTLELRRAGGEPVEVFAGERGNWVVAYGSDVGIPDGGPGRSVLVRPIDALEELHRELSPYRRVLQTLALAAPADRREALALGLLGSGLTRITTFEAQPWPPAWWHHDGRGPLRVLVRWVELEPG